MPSCTGDVQEQRARALRLLRLLDPPPHGPPMGVIVCLTSQAWMRTYVKALVDNYSAAFGGGSWLKYSATVRSAYCAQLAACQPQSVDPEAQMRPFPYDSLVLMAYTKEEDLRWRFTYTGHVERCVQGPPRESREDERRLRQ